MEADGVSSCLVVPGSGRKETNRMTVKGAGRWWVGCSRSSFCPPGICGAEGDWIGRQWFLTVKAKALPRFQRTWIKLSSVILRVLQGGTAVGGGFSGQCYRDIHALITSVL